MPVAATQDTVTVPKYRNEIRMTASDALARTQCLSAAIVFSLWHAPVSFVSMCGACSLDAMGYCMFSAPCSEGGC